MEKQNFELSLQEIQTIIACLGQFKAADVFELMLKLKAQEEKLKG